MHKNLKKIALKNEFINYRNLWPQNLLEFIENELFPRNLDIVPHKNELQG